MCKSWCVGVARIAVVAFAVAACAALGQERTTWTLAVDVSDRADARILDARVEATEEATGSRVDTATGSDGRAILHLNQGVYTIKVQANGFWGWQDTGVEVKAERHIDAHLQLSDECFPCTSISVPAEIPLEYRPIAAEIALIPMLEFVPTAKMIRHKSHWF